MPSEIKEFREPFVGGGGIFFGLPSDIPARWINDINEPLISVYKALRDRPDAFIKACRDILPMQPNEPEVAKGKGKTYNKRLGEIFNDFANNQEMDQALRYFFINRTVWAGRVTYDPKLKSRLYYSNPQGWNAVHREGFLESVAAHLQGTKITCGSYEELLAAEGQDVWIYLDPPYYRDTELVATDKQYQFGFTEQDHINFANNCKESKHKLCISYDNHPVIWELFKDFNVQKHEWAYSGTSQEVKTIGQELIITNYPPEKVDICA